MVFVYSDWRTSLCLFFFFSSRRRHTRCYRDWSSDVCSSDLGPSGSGKSTLFRAIGGIWPFGSGTVAIPEGARVMVLPQRPYLPIGSLDAAIAYPAAPGTFDADAVREVLQAVGLASLAPRLYEDAHWNR